MQSTQASKPPLCSVTDPQCKVPQKGFGRSAEHMAPRPGKLPTQFISRDACVCCRRSAHSGERLTAGPLRTVFQQDLVGVCFITLSNIKPSGTLTPNPPHILHPLLHARPLSPWYTCLRLSFAGAGPISPNGESEWTEVSPGVFPATERTAELTPSLEEQMAPFLPSFLIMSTEGKKV